MNTAEHGQGQHEEQQPSASIITGLPVPASARIGFDSAAYIEQQARYIQERREQIGGKLYLEMGGKLFDDLHASRVLPGFTPDNKIAMLQQLKDELEILISVSALDIQRQKIRADLAITYEDDVLRLIDVFRERGFLVENVVITQIAEEHTRAHEFSRRLSALGLKVTHHHTITGYPSAVEHVVSEQGFGANEYAETSRDLVVVTAPGPGSGKLATCLSQIYHEYQRGIPAGYAKFETFPIWNLPLEHPVNMAYEAATADLDDINVIDPYHLNTYGQQVTSYNRDVEVFPLLKRLLEKLAGHSPYESPTDMGVNRVGFCISDDEVVREAAEQEIIRRWYKARAEEFAVSDHDGVVSNRIEIIMGRAGAHHQDRAVVAPALAVAERTGQPGSALQLKDGTIITGKTSELLGCSAAMLLNALKYLAGIPDDQLLLSPDAIEPIQSLKVDHLGSRNPRLHTDEVLIALSVSAARDEYAKRAIDQLKNIENCDVHVTTILGSVDEGIFRSLGMRVTTEPQYQRKSQLYRKH